MSDPVRAIADAVLYEGYVLWPYRKGALKNQRRWTFGGIHPRAHAERHPDDRALARTQVLVEGTGGTRVDVAVRFLHVVGRQLRDGAGAAVGELRCGDELHQSWDEAREREIELAGLALDGLGEERSIAIAAGREREALAGGRGSVERSWAELAGMLTVRAERLEEGLWRLEVAVANDTPCVAGDREAALRQTFCSTHVVLCAHDGAFVSATDPPAERRAAVHACRHDGLWPVLVGPPDRRDTMLASPIILEDHPRIAPESPGDLFDGGEIDQLLTLGILAMTDEEQAAMRAADPRTRAILERTQGLGPEELMALHGAVREIGLVRR